MVQQCVAKSLTDQQPFEVEVRLIGQDHLERWISCHGRPHYDENGTPQRIIGVIGDISGRKRQDRERSQADAIFANAQEGVLITDREGTILTANPAFCMLMGYDAEDVIGRNPRLFKSDHHEDSFYRDMFEHAHRTGSWQGEIWNRRADGAAVPAWFSLTAIKDVIGAISGYVATYSDISYIKRSESQLEFLVHHDPLTRLPNRTLLLSRLQSAINRAQRDSTNGALLFLGLDRFKAVNDGYGHRVGDMVLQTVAQRCREKLHEADLLGRIGGDEFVVLLDDVPAPDYAARIAEGLIEALALPISVYGAGEIFLGASVGISRFPDDSANAERILRNAARR